MALKKGASPAAALPDEMPEVPTEVPRDRWDRPLIVPPGGGKPRAYTRASTLGKTIEDTYHLSRWAQRNVALGLSRRPDLVALAAAVRTNEGDDRPALDDIAERAHEAAKGDRGANIGTALHKLSERRDAGEDLSYLPAELAVALDAYSRCMAPLQVLASETFIVHDGLQAAGTFDRVVTPRDGVELVAPDGTRVGPDDALVLDIKTGKAESARYWGAGYAVQQAVYAHGVRYRHGVGRVAWSDLIGPGQAPSRAWALILHVPSDSPDDAGLVWVDLTLGAALAELCVEVRKARKVKNLFAECHVAAATPVACEGCGKAEHATDDCKHPYLLCERCNYDQHQCPGCGDEVPHAGPGVCEGCAKDLAEEAAAALAVPASAPAVPGGNTKPVPLQVCRALLAVELRQAESEDALTALWEANGEIWTEDATRMTTARLRELGLRPAVSR